MRDVVGELDQGLAAFAERHDGDAGENREDDDLQDLAIGEGFEDRGRHQMIDEAFDAERLRREIGGVGALIDDGADAGLQEIDHGEAEKQGDDRGADEPGHGLRADASDRCRIAHMADAHDERREHERPDDHLDELQEDGADERHILRDVSRGRLVGKGIVASGAEHDAEHETRHHIEEIAVHIPLPDDLEPPNLANDGARRLASG